jgi:pyruvate/2-oxoglutarate dehydrogenase complex dihydrolipoamide dehydrogenase (E3) component
MEVITGASVQALERDGEQVIVGLTRGGPAERVTTGAVFAAVGWPANVKDLDLDAAGVASDPRAIGADEYLKTNVGHIFAAGDVNGQAKLVQFARLEGRIAAWNAVHGPTRRLGYDVVPSGSFTNPEYGSVGLTEDQAAGHHDIGRSCRVRYAAASTRARRGGGGRTALAIASQAAVSRSPRTSAWQEAQWARWRSKLFRSGPARASSA